VGSEGKERTAGFEDFGKRLELVGDGRDDQIGVGGKNFGGFGGPGIGDDETLTIFNLGHHVRAVFCAGDDAIELAQCREDYGGTRLEAGDAAGRVRRGH